MTIQQIYNLAIQMGIKADPRGPAGVQKCLKKEKEKFEELRPLEKEIYDEERLVNPYADTRMHYGDPTTKVKRVLIGVDIDSAEILLAHHLGEKGKKIDLIIGHHPVGKALAGFDDVLRMQADLLHQYGVPINIADTLLEKRMAEIWRGVSIENHYQSVDAARLMGIPFINLHTPLDNLVYNFLRKLFKKNKSKIETVGDILKLLHTIPEYQQAARMATGPKLFSGKKANRCGNVSITEITGGTEGSKDIYQWLAKAGIGTVVGMHLSERGRNEAEKYHINVVIAGHISSDSIGINLFLDELEKRGVDILSCSGIIRVSRRKKRAG